MDDTNITSVKEQYTPIAIPITQIPQDISNVEQTFPDRKPNILIKIYLALCCFVVVGFILFFILFFANNSSLNFPQDSQPWILLVFILKIWGLVFVYILPLGLINLGLWSIIYKESAIKTVPSSTGIYVPPTKLQGNGAVISGIFYLILGLILTWGVTGVLLGLICKQSFCEHLPTFIKFF